MSPHPFWLFIQIVALFAIPVIVVRGVHLWSLIKTGRFRYKPIRGESVPTTRAERPGWYWWAIISNLMSIAVSLWLIGFVGFWTFHPR